MPTSSNGQPNPNPRQPVDIARILLVITILTALTVGSLYVLRPFLPGLIWATTIVVATWPLMRAVQRRCGNRRWIATSVMLFMLLIVIVLPLYEAISTLALHGGEIMAAIKSLPSYALAPPPHWVHDVPVAGQRIAEVELPAGEAQEFYTRDFALPPALVQGANGKLEVKFVAKEGSMAGGLYGLRLMR